MKHSSQSLTPHHSSWPVLLVTICMVLVACGSDSPTLITESVATEGDATNQSDTVDPPVEETRSAAPATTQNEASDDGPSASVDAPGDAAPATVTSDAPALESIYAAEPGTSGWAIPAGEWISHSFSPPLLFTLPVDGIVTSDSADAIEILIGDPAAPDGYIVISTPIAVSRPTGPIPIDLVDADNALVGAEVEFSNEGEGPFGLYTERDIVMPDNPPFDEFLTPCFRTDTRQCLDPLVTRAGFVLLEAGTSHRVVTSDYGNDGRLYVVATPTDTNDADFRSLATEIAVSVAPIEGSTHSDPRWLASLGTRVSEIPAGNYVARVGNAVVDFPFDMALENIELPILTPAALGFEDAGGAGFVWIIDFTDFLDPDTGRARTDRTADGSLSAELYEAGVRDVLAVSATGTDLIGGIQAQWFDVVADPETGEPCSTVGWSNPQASCLIWTSTPLFKWYSASDTVARQYYLETEGLTIFLSPTPGHTVDDVATRFAPLLDAMMITPAG